MLVLMITVAMIVAAGLGISMMAAALSTRLERAVAAELRAPTGSASIRNRGFGAHR